MADQTIKCNRCQKDLTDLEKDKDYYILWATFCWDCVHPQWRQHKPSLANAKIHSVQTIKKVIDREPIGKFRSQSMTIVETTHEKARKKSLTKKLIGAMFKKIESYTY